MPKDKIYIDIAGPKGNAFYLLATARKLCKQLEKDWEDIQKRMTSGDYENLTNVFEEEFGDYVQLCR